MKSFDRKKLTQTTRKKLPLFDQKIFFVDKDNQKKILYAPVSTLPYPGSQLHAPIPKRNFVLTKDNQNNCRTFPSPSHPQSPKPMLPSPQSYPLLKTDYHKNITPCPTL